MGFLHHLRIKIMITRLYLIFFLSFSVLLSSCGEDSEDSRTFYDEFLQHELIKNLEDSGIDFRIEENTIWYAVDDRESVKQAWDKAINDRPLNYEIYDKNKAAEFAELLTQAGIDNELSSRNEVAFIVSVPRADEEKAQRILRELLFSDVKIIPSPDISKD